MRTFIFFFILMFLPLLEYGQEVIYENETRRNSIPLRRNPNAAEPFLNDILDTLRDPQESRIRGLIFYYDKKVNIIRDKNQLNFNVSLDNLKYRGNTLYRNFETSDVLIPNHVSYIIDWYSGTQKRLKSITVERSPVDTESLSMETYVQKDSLKLTNYNIKTKGFVFHFDEMNWLGFKSRIDFIDEFYRDYDSIKGRVKRIRSNEFVATAGSDELPKASRFVNDTKSFAKLVREKDYESLKIGQGKRIPDLFIQLEVLEQLNAHLYDSVQVVIHGRNKKAVQNIEKLIVGQDYDRAKKVITQELLPLGLFSIGYYYLAEIYYCQKQFDLSRKRITSLSNNFAIEDAIKSKCDKLVMKLDRVLLDTVLHLANEKKYEESLELLNSIVELTNISKSAKELLPHNPAITSLLKKIHQSYSDYGQSKYTTGNFQPAIDWFKHSMDICENFGVPVCEQQLEAKINESKIEYQQKLIKTIIEDIENYDLDKAEAKFQEEKIFRQENGLKKLPLLDAAIILRNRKQYIKSLKNANTLFHKKEYSASLENYMEAKALAKENKFNTPEIIDSLLLATTDAYLNIFLVDSLRGSSAENPNEVENAMAKIGLVQKGVKGKYAKKLKAKNDSLKNLLSNACEAKHLAFNNYITGAQKHRKSASFLIADSLLQFAIGLTGEYESCEIDPTTAFEIKQEIALGVGYELTLDKIMDEIADYNFPDAIEQYNSLSEYYNIYQLGKLGLQHESLQNFIAKTDNIEFINFCIGKFSDMDNFETALFLLNNLYHRGTNHDKARNGQIALGIILATKDFQDNSGRPVKEMIERYTNGDEWFQHFERVYSIRWEMLQDNK